MLFRSGLRAKKHSTHNHYLTLPVLFDEDQEVSRSFMVRGLPTTIVIGRDGKICYKHAGIATKETFESEVKSLL